MKVVHVLGQLKVRSYEEWKPDFDKRSTIREKNGSKGACLFRDIHDHNQVVILFEWDSLENAYNYFESESLQKSLEEEGHQIINIIYLDDIEKTI